MLVQPGAIYRLGLAVYNAEGYGPAWLVGAIGASLPLAETVAIEAYSPAGASVLVRWTDRPGQIDEGMVLAPLSQGVAVAGARVPSATVGSVELVSMTVSAAPFYGAAKMAIAVVLVGVTAIFCSRIKHVSG